MDYVRLAHTIEKQILDPELQKITVGDEDNDVDRVELKIFELIDLFMRDSNLGVFQSRLIYIRKLLKYFIAKQPTVDSVQLIRLVKVLRILNFSVNYYTQFEPKLQKTIERLDAKAREKVKTLIDVGKWSV